MLGPDSGDVTPQAMHGFLVVLESITAAAREAMGPDTFVSVELDPSAEEPDLVVRLLGGPINHPWQGGYRVTTRLLTDSRIPLETLLYEVKRAAAKIVEKRANV